MAQVKTLNLDSLVPDKVLVPTTLGSIFVGGHSFSRDILTDSGNDLEAGKLIVQSVCNFMADKSDHSPLPVDHLSRLNADDLMSLGPAIAAQQRWESEQPPVTFEAIAAEARLAQVRDLQLLREEFDKVSSSLKRNFAFLNESTLSKLSNDLTGIWALRRTAQDLSARGAIAKQLSEFPSLGSLSKSSLTNASELNLDSEPSLVTPTEEPKLPKLKFVPPEETALGRAQLETAQQVTLMTELMTELTSKLAGFHETMVNDVLPAWFRKVEDDQKQSEENSKQTKLSAISAAKSLKWAQWTLVASLFVSIATAGWQVYVTTQIDTTNSKQQLATQAASDRQQQKVTEILQSILDEERKVPKHEPGGLPTQKPKP